jgi:hypothetical protein
MLFIATLIGPQSPPTADFWRQEYRVIMSATSDRARPQPDTAVPRLVGLYVSLEHVEAVPRTERTRMRRSLEGRLVKQLEVLVRQQRKRGQSDPRTNGKELAGGGANALAAQSLIDLIINTIEPDSWRQNGGKGSITYYPYNPALVIRQTSETHEQFSELLRALSN